MQTNATAESNALAVLPPSEIAVPTVEAVFQDGELDLAIISPADHLIAHGKTGVAIAFAGEMLPNIPVEDADGRLVYLSAKPQQKLAYNNIAAQAKQDARDERRKSSKASKRERYRANVAARKQAAEHTSYRETYVTDMLKAGFVEQRDGSWAKPVEVKLTAKEKKERKAQLVAQHQAGIITDLQFATELMKIA